MARLTAAQQNSLAVWPRRQNPDRHAHNSTIYALWFRHGFWVFWWTFLVESNDEMTGGGVKHLFMILTTNNSNWIAIETIYQLSASLHCLILAYLLSFAWDFAWLHRSSWRFEYLMSWPKHTHKIIKVKNNPFNTASCIKLKRSSQHQ
jgi:hypothetical protein